LWGAWFFCRARLSLPPIPPSSRPGAIIHPAPPNITRLMCSQTLPRRAKLCPVFFLLLPRLNQASVHLLFYRSGGLPATPLTPSRSNRACNPSFFHSSCFVRYYSPFRLLVCFRVAISIAPPAPDDSLRWMGLVPFLFSARFDMPRFSRLVANPPFSESCDMICFAFILIRLSITPLSTA